MGALFQSAPAVMLCKPTTNDRWDRRAVELAAFVHLHGHSNVPLARPRPRPQLAHGTPRHTPLVLHRPSGVSQKTAATLRANFTCSCFSLNRWPIMQRAAFQSQLQL